jgi:hypothetical protein
MCAGGGIDELSRDAHPVCRLRAMIFPGSIEFLVAKRVKPPFERGKPCCAL